MADIRIIDTLLLEHPARKTAVQAAQDALGENSVLKVSIDSTHSGLLANNRVYPGVFVRRSYKTYFSKERGGTAEFDKPILTHHNHQSDPIGRIVGGKFTPLKTGDSFLKDYENPDIPAKGGRGSGVVTISAEIYDEDAIQKILDGRYLSVSSGQSSSFMGCSICGKPLVSPISRLFGGGDEEACEHIPGRVYRLDKGGKRLCYAVTGPLTYHEVSFVTIPAQPAAKVVSTDWENIKALDFEGAIEFSHKAEKTCIRDMRLVDVDGDAIDLLADYRSKVMVSITDTAAGNLEEILTSLQEESELPPEEDDGATRQPIPAPEREDGSVDDADNSHLSRMSTSEGRDTNQLDNPTERTMTKELDELKATVDSLSEEKKTLQDTLKAKDAEIEDLKARLDEKTEALEQAMNDLEKMQSELAEDYATLVAQYRILLRKPGTEEIKDEEARQELVDKLAKRTVSSLRDSLSDLALELNSSDLTQKGSPSSSRVGDKKVTLHDNDEPSNDKKDDDPVGDPKALLSKIITGG